jgi:hypothetical protein
MIRNGVVSLDMGTCEGGARQGEKSDCLEEHVGWMDGLMIRSVWRLSEADFRSEEGWW